MVKSIARNNLFIEKLTSGNDLNINAAKSKVYLNDIKYKGIKGMEQQCSP